MIKISICRNLLLILCCLILIGLFGYWQASIACLFLFLCMLPGWLISQRSRFFSVKVILGTVIFTVSVSLVLFYLFPQDYHYQHHRPFNYTAIDSFPVSVILGLFFTLFVSASRVWEIILPSFINHQSSASSILYTPPKSRSLIFQLIIFSIILCTIPFNIWMYNRGLGLTGVEPSEPLPYRLTGVLIYLEKLIIPGVITLLYLHTRRRSFSFILLLGFYASFIGISTLSRGVALLVLIFPLYFSWFEHRYILFLITLISALFAILLATEARYFLYLGENNSIIANNSLYIGGLIYETIFQLLQEQNGIIHEIVMIFPLILSRIEAFHLLFLSSQFDASSVGGPWEIWLKSLHWGLTDLGHDAVHIEFFGSTVPMGFYNAASTLSSYTLWASNNNLSMLFIFALTSSFYLVTLEWSINRILYKYKLLCLSSPFIFVISIFYYMSIGWPVFLPLTLLFLFLALVPRLTIVTFIFHIIGLQNRSIITTHKS